MTREHIRNELTLCDATLNEKGNLIDSEYRDRIQERYRKLKKAMQEYDENFQYKFIGCSSYDLRV